MPLTIKENTIHFSTGKKVHAYFGIVGIRRTEKDIEVTSGYSDFIYSDGIDFLPPKEHDDLIKKERQELADYMIELWEDFKNA